MLKGYRMQIGKIMPVIVGNHKITGSTKNLKNNAVNSVSNFEYMNKAAANAIKANISFGVNFVDNKIPPRGINIGNIEKQLSVKVLLNGEGRINDNTNYTYEEVIDKTLHSFQVQSSKEDGKRNFMILQNGKPVLEGSIKDSLKDDVKIEFKTAKHKPEAKVTLRDGTTIQLLEGSIIKANDGSFELRNPGKYNVIEDGEKVTKRVFAKNQNDISFTGNVTSLLCKKDATINATNASRNLPFIVSGIYYNEVAQDNPTFAVLAGGFGTRFDNMTSGDINKPSFVMPNGQSILSSAYDLVKNATAAKKLDDILYLEQVNTANGPANHNLVNRSDDIRPMNAFASDGGAIMRAVLDGEIRTDKPLIILNADTITNVDISQAYHKLKSLDSAAMVIPSYPVSETRAKSFGLMAAGETADEQGSNKLVDFIEKPKNPREGAVKAMIIGKEVNGEQAYNGNPGIYIFNKEVLQNLEVVLDKAGEIALKKAQDKARSLGEPIPTSLKDPYSSSTFLGNAFVPAVVALCQEGRLLDENGNKMNTYMVPMLTATEKQAYWDDIGAAEAFVHVCQDIAFETVKNGATAKNSFYGVRGIQDFADSVDLQSGIVYASPKDKENFETFHSDEFFIEGDSYIKCR